MAVMSSALLRSDLGGGGEPPLERFSSYELTLDGMASAHRRARCLNIGLRQTWDSGHQHCVMNSGAMHISNDQTTESRAGKSRTPPSIAKSDDCRYIVNTLPTLRKPPLNTLSTPSCYFETPFTMALVVTELRQSCIPTSKFASCQPCASVLWNPKHGDYIRARSKHNVP